MQLIKKKMKKKSKKDKIVTIISFTLPITVGKGKAKNSELR